MSAPGCRFEPRDAVPADVASIADLVRELAEDEGLGHEAVATAADFQTAPFGATPRANAIMADVEGVSVGWRIAPERGDMGEGQVQHQSRQGEEARQEKKVYTVLPNGLDSPARCLVDAGLKVHRALGPGLLESTYEHCLARELSLRNITFRRQVALPIVYEGEEIDAGYRLDLVVQDSIVIEIKATEGLARLHEAQLLSYLKLSIFRVGFSMNFNVVLFTQGPCRLVN